jgi:hypothetical protein
VPIKFQAPKPYDEIGLVRLVDRISDEADGMTWIEGGLTPTQADIVNRELERRGVQSRVVPATVVAALFSGQRKQPDDGSDSTAGAG